MRNDRSFQGYLIHICRNLSSQFRFFCMFLNKKGVQTLTSICLFLSHFSLDCGKPMISYDKFSEICRVMFPIWAHYPSKIWENDMVTSMLWVLSNYSTKLLFSPESSDINLHEITIFCCSKSIFECINGFIMLKNPWGTRIIQK